MKGVIIAEIDHRPPRTCSQANSQWSGALSRQSVRMRRKIGRHECRRKTSAAGMREKLSKTISSRSSNSMSNTARTAAGNRLGRSVVVKTIEKRAIASVAIVVSAGAR